MISYAPSVNNSQIGDFKKFPEYVDAIHKLNFVSVRDGHSKKVIDELLNRVDIPLVTDPTLLHDKRFYCNHMEAVETVASYILLYSYGTHLKKETIDKIVTFAKENNLKLISILEYFEWCDYNVAPSPFVMLYYFYKAKFVITDTFHGTIFSIIFNKNFVIASKSSTKIMEFLNEINLESRVLEKETPIDTLFSQKIEYDEINRRVSSKRNASKQYLKDVILEIHRG